jgi:peptidoglycan hydrolase-like protein with peptidoglycan-binding domain
MNILRLNCEGKKVKQLQRNLIQLGYLLTINGVFEKNTETVVKQFQKDNNLKVDGEVGWYTNHKISSLVSSKNKGIDSAKNNEVFDWKAITKWIYK